MRRFLPFIISAFLNETSQHFKFRSALIRHKLFYSGGDDPCGLLDAEGRGVDRHIVIIEFAPLVARVEVVIRGAALVGLCDNVDYLRALKLGVTLLYSLLAVIDIAVDEYSEEIWLLCR